MDTILKSLEPGMAILTGGDKVAYVSDELAAQFKEGDRLIAVRKTGDLLHIPKAVYDIVYDAMTRCVNAYEKLQNADDNNIIEFYKEFAERIDDNDIWDIIAKANETDITKAKEKGRSTTRLAADEKMRTNMIAGLREWMNMPSQCNKVIDTVQHEGWSVERIAASCGVVGFVFEGRPNVLADATGVLRGGNTAVFRIGSDALGTAKSIMENALKPALTAAGLPEDSIVLLESAEHAAGWALFADNRLALAVARGSGRAVDLLGAVAGEAGNAASLHGTGGAWIIADETADPTWFDLAVYYSCDRKVCNTVNTVCVPRSRPDLIKGFIEALKRRGEKIGHGFRLHVAEGSEGLVPSELFNTETDVYRAAGIVKEKTASKIPIDQLGREWEWEKTPEVSFVAVDNFKEGVDLFNAYSPLLAASLISESDDSHSYFLRSVNAPFIGNGFTRWVDGQYALLRPELGLSNWQNGRLFSRSAMLTGDGVFTIKLRVKQTDPDVHR